ncbi:MAG TPA: FmdB family zinc ribbon protein [Gemmatimonadaceae bacterium]|nr:FmdB family zinc ribbon protein [Gemmatimonadaceae bacterium]
MPTYEFRCPNGHDFERFYGRISEAPSEVACPECGAIAERRISGGAGLVFKGSGFYITDYGKDGKKDLKAAATSKEAGGSKSEGGAKSDSSSSGASKPDGGASAAPAAKPSKPAGGE